MDAHLLAQTPMFSAGLALLVLAIAAAGVMLTFAGAQLLALVLGAVGLGVGSLLGVVLGDTLLAGVPLWVCAVGGGIVGAVIASLSSRLAAAVILAIVFGAAGWLGVASAERRGWVRLEALVAPSNAPATSTSSPAAGSAEGTDDASASDDASRHHGTASAALRLAAGELMEASTPDGPLNAFLAAHLEPRLDPFLQPIEASVPAELSAGLSTGLSAATTPPKEVIRLLRREWEAASRPQRTLMIACSAMCAFVGLCFGIVAPRWTAAVTTSLLGSALLIGCAAVAMAQLAPAPGSIASGGSAASSDAAGSPRSMASPSSGSPTTWTIFWGVLALAGTAVQCSRREPKRDQA